MDDQGLLADELELSTKLVIQETYRRNASVEILDPRDNMIRITKESVSVILKQATKTQADSYIAAIIMENKTVTKRLLSEAGLRVPAGYEVGDVSELKLPEKGKSAANLSFARGIAVKPKSTNFGIGVTILNSGFTVDELRAAAIAALKHDNSVLVEEKIEGTELRFLVIAGEVRAVLERVPAHVDGDGVSTVRQLVRVKNTDPRRGSGYRFPMEKIQLGGVEKKQLVLAGMDTESVPDAGQRVFLRKNSNISTGGEGIDRTDDVHPGYFDIAVRAAGVVGAAICGIDIIIGDYSRKPDPANYGIIELNFNPALHIHDFPSVGKNRHVEKYVLDLLNIK